MSVLTVTQASKQLALLERTVRAIRAGLDASAIQRVLQGEQRETEIELSNGLSELLSSPKQIGQTRVEPYEKFLPGLACAHANRRGNFVSVETIALSSPSSSPELPGSCCLLIHPTFNKSDMAEWMTLEIDLDISQIKRLLDLTLQIIPMFRFEGAADLPNYGVQLRVFRSREFTDYAWQQFPSLSFPIEVTYRISREQMAAIDRESATHGRILIHLPLEWRHEYTTIISHFACFGTVLA